MRVVSVAERRARLGRRHHLAPGHAGTGPVAVADRLVGYHATDPATVFLSVQARVPGLRPADLEAVLYDDGALVRHLCMRRTLFTVSNDVMPVVQAACSDAVTLTQRKRLIKEVIAAGIASDGAEWLERALAATIAEIERVGGGTGQQLSKAVPEIQAKMSVAEGKAWGGEIGVANRIFTILAAEGVIVRGRPGKWTSSQHRWLAAPPGAGALSEAAAVEALVGRWLAAFGPAPVSDIAWWTGLGLGKIRAALAALAVVEVDLDGEVGVLLADDVDPEPEAEPWVALLPSLDSSTMGWQKRAWYLGEHGAQLFDRNGNGGPAVWCNGAIVGGWAQRKGGEVVWRLLEDIGTEATAAVEAEAARLQTWLGDAVVRPRFPTPIDKSLRS